MSDEAFEKFRKSEGALWYRSQLKLTHESAPDVRHSVQNSEKCTSGCTSAPDMSQKEEKSDVSKERVISNDINELVISNDISAPTSEGLTFDEWFKKRYPTSGHDSELWQMHKESWQAGQKSTWDKLSTTDFLVMGAIATGSATVENKHLWDVYWRTIELLKEKITGYQKEAKK